MSRIRSITVPYFWQREPVKFILGKVLLIARGVLVIHHWRGVWSMMFDAYSRVDTEPSTPLACTVS